ncbi:MAG: PqiC family protein [Lentimonas sp.]
MHSLQGALKMKNKRSAFFLYIALYGALSITLGGCVNLKPKADPVKLYALGPVNSAVDGRESGRPIYVARPHMPAYLDGKHLQYRSANGEVEALSHARWAEPLEEGVARCLAEYLIQPNGKNAIGFYPWPDRTKNGLDLYLQIFKLGVFENSEIRMTVSWELKSGSKTQQAGTFQSKGITWETGSAESLVAGINLALAQLAEEVAQSF